MNSERSRFVFKDEDGKKILAGCSHDARTTDHEQIFNRIMDKIGDLNSGRYDHYDTDALYIDDEQSFIFEIELPDFLNFMRDLSNQYSRYYSHLFIYTQRDLHMFELEKGISKKIRITDEMRGTIRKEATLMLDKIMR